MIFGERFGKLANDLLTWDPAESFAQGLPVSSLEPTIFQGLGELLVLGSGYNLKIRNPENYVIHIQVTI